MSSAVFSVVFVIIFLSFSPFQLFIMLFNRIFNLSIIQTFLIFCTVFPGTVRRYLCRYDKTGQDSYHTVPYLNSVRQAGQSCICN